jgi:hypothetical protein
MPVKLTTTQTIPFLSSYTPPVLPDTPLVEDIRDMISVDLQTLETPYIVEYPIGASFDNPLAFRVTFRNLTTNATLTVSQKQTKDLLLLLDDNNVFENRTISLVLPPNETRGLNILFNNNLLNSAVQSGVLENLQLIVAYQTTGDLVARNSLDRLPPITLL